MDVEGFAAAMLRAPQRRQAYRHLRGSHSASSV